MLLPFDPSRTERVRSAGWRRTLVAAGVLAVCLTLGWALRGPLLQGLAQLWVVSESPGRADAIVVLGGGLDTRPFAVAELYRRGFATRVLLANTKTGPAEELGVLPPHMDLNRAVLIRLGVPSEAISLFGEQLSNTYEEAARSAYGRKQQVRELCCCRPTAFPPAGCDGSLGGSWPRSAIAFTYKR